MTGRIFASHTVSGNRAALKRSVLAASLIGFVIACAGCAGRTAEGVLTAAADTVSFEGTSRVTILAATTRQRSNGVPGVMFTGTRGNGLSYASISISIPPDSARKVGEVQWPASLPGDPRRDFVTTSANYIGKKEFSDAITATVKQTGRNKVLVFIHGFNNKFDDAVYRFAQVVHDAKAPGIPVLFSWPSRGELNLRSYTYDRESANYSRDALEELLDQIASNPNVAEINIVAHSMGNWVTLESLRTRSIETHRAKTARAKRILDKVKNVLLVAPDVDVDVFRTQIARIGTPRPRIAVFVSQDDTALALSKTLWGGVPRLGEIDPNAEPYRSEFERDHIEAFDLTKLKTAGDNAHDRAFQDVTTVVQMLKQRFGEDLKNTAPPRSAAR
jgi:esterase/lipase superfamily enzyme